jgi:hypothetical protein
MLLINEAKMNENLNLFALPNYKSDCLLLINVIAILY